MALFEMHRYLWKSSRRSEKTRHRRTLAQVAGAMEVLEARLAPVVSTWLGAVDGSWANDANWDVPPVDGNDLVFPAVLSQLTTTNDLTTASSFGSLTIAGDGYSIGGAPITLSNTVDASFDSMTSTISLPI